MAYDQQTWVLGLGGGTALNAVRLNHMEQGIADAHSLIATLSLADHTHTSAQITDATAANTINTIVKRDGTGFIAVSGITGLATATGSSQAVPKSQLDDAIAALASTTHTHVVADITNITATGASLVEAVDTAAARDVLDVYSTGDVDTAVSTAVASEATARTTAIAAEATARNTAIAAGVDHGLEIYAYSGGLWPVRPNTTGTNRRIGWLGPASNPIPTSGNSTGGTRSAAPGDIPIYY